MSYSKLKRSWIRHIKVAIVYTLYIESTYLIEKSTKLYCTFSKLQKIVNSVHNLFKFRQSKKII